MVHDALLVLVEGGHRGARGLRAHQDVRRLVGPPGRLWRRHRPIRPSGADSRSAGRPVHRLVPRHAESELRTNPHLRWTSNRRGYVMATLTPDLLTADFRTLPFVEKPGATATTARHLGGRVRSRWTGAVLSDLP
ncbi:hypothetical protein GCM10009812_30430 [Nocardioides marinus]